FGLGITNLKSEFSNRAPLRTKRHETLGGWRHLARSRNVALFPLKHDLKTAGWKKKGIVTAQLVADIPQLFVPYECVGEAHPRNNHPKCAENVLLLCPKSRPAGGPSFARIANL
ncbi:unnamed protein product, partial [Laminaria digitata]